MLILRVTCGRAQQRQARATVANAAARYHPRCVVNRHDAGLSYLGSLGKVREAQTRRGERVPDADGVCGGNAAVPHAVCRGEFLLKDLLCLALDSTPIRNTYTHVRACRM